MAVVIYSFEGHHHVKFGALAVLPLQSARNKGIDRKTVFERLYDLITKEAISVHLGHGVVSKNELAEDGITINERHREQIIPELRVYVEAREQQVEIYQKYLIPLALHPHTTASPDKFDDHTFDS